MLEKAIMPGRVKYVQGDVTAPESGGLRFVLQINNDGGKCDTDSIAQRWPQVEKEYRKWYRMSANPNTALMPLGKIQTIPVQSDISVISMIVQKTSKRKLITQYDALDTCLKQVAELAQTEGASVHMPRISASATGRRDGKKLDIASLIEQHFIKSGINVTVYESVT